MIFDLQKASMWKRISAFLFDGILLSIVAVLFAWGLAVCTGYDGYNDALNARYAHFEEAHQVSFQLSLAEYEALTAEQLEALDEAYQALAADEEAVYAYNMVVQLTLLITSLGIFLGFLALEFAIPLFLKNGQTLGKKIFGLAVMRTDGVKVAPVQMFIRAVLGKYAIETMIPVLILLMIFFNSIGVVGPLVLGLILIVQIIVLIATPTNSLIHDLLAKTVTVDLASQMIFESTQAMIAYKQKVQAEKAAQQPY